MKYFSSYIAGLLLCALLFVAGTATALADGTEQLGPPQGVTIAAGSGLVAAGTGMLAVEQPGEIDLTVPDNAVIKQVLLYWEGQMRTNVAGDNTIRINGTTEVTGALIGGRTRFFGGAFSSAFRADITGLNLIAPGVNQLELDQLSFTKIANGAGIIVIYDDGSGQSVIDLRDGLDLAYIGFAEPLKNTVAQTFTFAPSGIDRVATFTYFASSVAVAGSVPGEGARPESLELTVSGVITPNVFSNELNSWDGNQWDTKTNSVVVPAGATTLTAQIFSRDDTGTVDDPSSLAWIAGALNIKPPTPGLVIKKFTNGADADGANDADVPVIAPGDSITWTYEVTNNGSIPFSLTEVVVTDDQLVPVTGPVKRIGNDDDVLAPGEIWIYQATGVAQSLTTNPSGVKIVTGCDAGGTQPSRPTYENIGTVVGTTSLAGTVTDSDPSHYCNPNVAAPAITIKKYTNGDDADLPTGPQIPVGGAVNWTYIVTNIGNVDLINVIVTDDKGVAVTCPQTTLAVGANMTCTGTGVAVAGQYANIGSVVGTPVGGGNQVRDDDPSHYFGYIPAAVGNQVFGDINPNGTTPEEIGSGNGLQDDPREPGIDGVIVELYTIDGTLVSTMTTSNGGQYLFDNLPPGDYYLIFINPLGQGVWTAPNVGANDAIDSDPFTVVTDPRGDAVQTDPFTLTSGETDLDWDAGLINLSGAASAAVGNRVWVDANQNGIQDPGELGFPGATVRLYSATGTLLQTTTTNDQGIYGFNNLDPGSYFIEFVKPTNFNVSPLRAGSDDELDSDGDLTTGRTRIFTLIDFETNLRFDYGIFAPTSLDPDGEPLRTKFFLPLVNGL